MYFDSFLLELDPKHGQPLCEDHQLKTNKYFFLLQNLPVLPLDILNENVEKIFINSVGI
jgi:hypothetical protein